MEGFLNELVRWVFQQGGVVIVLLSGFAFFFRFVVPAFRKIEEKHETVLREQITEHRTLRDAERTHYLATIEKMASAHQVTVEKIVQAHQAAVGEVVASVNRLALRLEGRADAADRRADAADRRDKQWQDTQ